MAAATVTFSAITGTQGGLQRWGNLKVRVVRLTLVFATSTYVDDGLSDATNFPAATWFKRLKFNRVFFAIPMGLLKLATNSVAYPFSVDTTNAKIVLFGGATTAAEDVGLEEIPDSAALTNGTYTADVLMIGK